MMGKKQNKKSLILLMKQNSQST